jgi:hypothetical protein
MKAYRPFAFVIMIILILAGTSILISNASSGEDANSPPTREEESFSFDFGSREHTMEHNTPVTNTTRYSSQLGYGFLEEAETYVVTSRMVGEDPSPHVLDRSWVYEQYGNDLTMDGVRSEEKVSFRVDLPNGTYRLVLWLGDLEKGIYSMNVSVNDEWLMEGADAFHTVHRSMYFKWNPNPRFPDLEFINYGMAIPYYLKVNVTEGHMIINITGNDDAYWDLLDEELAKEPAISYLSWMSTGGIKKSGGTGPWRYVGGPFTKASVMGMNIHQFPNYPINEEIEGFSVDDDINADEVINGISALNTGNLEGAFLHWKSSMEDELRGRNRLARSQLDLV